MLLLLLFTLINFRGLARGETKYDTKGGCVLVEEVNAHGVGSIMMIALL